MNRFATDSTFPFDFLRANVVSPSDSTLFDNTIIQNIHYVTIFNKENSQRKQRLINFERLFSLAARVKILAATIAA